MGHVKSYAALTHLATMHSSLFQANCEAAYGELPETATALLQSKTKKCCATSGAHLSSLEIFPAKAQVSMRNNDISSDQNKFGPIDVHAAMHAAVQAGWYRPSFPVPVRKNCDLISY